MSRWVPNTQPVYILSHGGVTHAQPTLRLPHYYKQGKPLCFLPPKRDHHHPKPLISEVLYQRPLKRTKSSIKFPNRPRATQMAHRNSRVLVQTKCKCEETSPIRKRPDQILREKEKRVPIQMKTFSFLTSQGEEGTMGSVWDRKKARCNSSPSPFRSKLPRSTNASQPMNPPDVASIYTASHGV